MPTISPPDTDTDLDAHTASEEAGAASTAQRRKSVRERRKRIKAARKLGRPIRRELRDGDGERRRNVRKALARHREMREPSTQKIYDIWAGIYDNSFGRLVKKRVGKAIREHVKLEQGQVCLDVGIGTGASLHFYPDDRGQVIGVDLSRGMLDKAMDKLDESGRDNATVAQANALTLPFADDSFDVLFVSHVITVVSDPVKLLYECCRVAKPGAKLVMVNHFRSENKLVGFMEKLVCPICTKLGWKSDLALGDLTEKTGLAVDYRYKLTTPDLWETVVVTNSKPQAKNVAA
ncbi:MAG: methyltransferase domain-containing protein [Planctomycetota bacterium]